MKVAVAGYGIEGRANYDYWHALGHDVTIVDERPLRPDELPSEAKLIVGKKSLESLTGFDLVVRTAGLAPHKLPQEGKVWSATNEFFEKCPAPIIGVTGTKGKGTTSSLIASILAAADKRVHLVGNIGLPALSVLPDVKPSDIVIYEMSSFQLWDVERSPHVAVVLMLEPDHLDIHRNFKDYITAKANIRRHQRAEDICIFHPTNPYAHQIAESSDHGIDGAVRYGVVDDGQAYVKSNKFVIQNTVLCDVDALQVPGVHNRENACAAISAAYVYTQDAIAIEKGLRAFTGLEHRLKNIGTVHDVTYYDDSIATTPGSAIAALRSFKEPKIMIVGGKDKGADYDELYREFGQCQSMRAVLCIGENGSKLAAELRKLMPHEKVIESTALTMKQIVTEASGLAAPGDVVVLSPAAASFDMFKSYTDRGEQFIRAVKHL